MFLIHYKHNNIAPDLYVVAFLNTTVVKYLNLHKTLQLRAIYMKHQLVIMKRYVLFPQILNVSYKLRIFY